MYYDDDANDNAIDYDDKNDADCFDANDNAIDDGDKKW